MDKNQLFEKYQNWARNVANQLYRKTNFSGAEYDDYLQYSYLGLMEAINNFDENQEGTFIAYSQLRIKGTILNSIFKFSEYSWSRHKLRAIKNEYVDSIVNGVEETLPHAEEALRSLITQITYDILINQTSEQSEDIRAVDGAIYDSLEYKLMIDKIKHRRETLPPDYQSVIGLYYNLGQSYSEIASILDLSKTQVFNIHKKAINLIRDSLTEHSSYSI
ncbi:sigma-70 family RNA polymerase sigma factor [Catenovulum sp. SM1970]|uniref:sigma-70 family RNA polymerase sigma factor n=1 Tax=Marinifaba aquimaris TaxID=2741323 RepID=UPI00157455A7|nr:sigma-70 family RNA polymerase sigma factor [Marinifaba aquimaris]NTS77374.1 sigma-70 family RNA polymerase sigma factor [Marinifaba aquimaris]